MAIYKDTLLLIDEVTKPLAKIALKMQATQKAAQHLTGTAGKLQRRMDYVGKAFTNAGNKIKSAESKITGTVTKITAGVVAVSGAFVYGLNKAADYADNIDKMSQKIGMSAEKYQEMNFVLSQNGMNIDNLQMGYKTLTNKMVAAQKGSKDATTLFKKLNVTIKMNNGELRNSDEVFDDVIKKLLSMKNPTERMATAIQLFGRNAQELAPLLNNGLESYEKLKKTAQEKGMILSNEEIANAVKYKDTMDKFSKMFETRIAALAIKYMPKVTTYLDKIMSRTDLWDKIIVSLGKLINLIVKIVDWFVNLNKVGKIVVTVFTGFLLVLGPLLTTIGSLISAVGTILPLLGTLSVSLPAIAGAIGGVTTAVGLSVAAFMSWAWAIKSIKNELNAWGDTTKGITKESLAMKNLNTGMLSNSALEKMQYQRRRMGDKAYKSKYGAEGLQALKDAEKSGRISKTGNPMGTTNNNQSYTYNTTNNYGLGGSFSPLGGPGIVIAN